MLASSVASKSSSTFCEASIKLVFVILKIFSDAEAAIVTKNEAIKEIPRMSMKILRTTDELYSRLCVAGELSTRIEYIISR